MVVTCSQSTNFVPLDLIENDHNPTPPMMNHLFHVVDQFQEQNIKMLAQLEALAHVQEGSRQEHEDNSRRNNKDASQNDVAT